MEASGKGSEWDQKRQKWPQEVGRKEAKSPNARQPTQGNSDDDTEWDNTHKMRRKAVNAHYGLISTYRHTLKGPSSPLFHSPFSPPVLLYRNQVPIAHADTSLELHELRERAAASQGGRGATKKKKKRRR